jgi:hypothetical protein
MILHFQNEINVIMYIIELKKKKKNSKWGGLMVGMFASILKVKGSNLISGVVCGQQW